MELLSNQLLLAFYLSFYFSFKKKINLSYFLFMIQKKHTYRYDIYTNQK